MGVAGVLGAALLCAIHGATVEKTLFEDGDGANTFRAFNPTQAETQGFHSCRRESGEFENLVRE
jgi:hypothetical protein